MTDFKSLNLLPSILKALDNKGYTIPTPIQEKSIPSLIAGKDLLGIAQTGTGKTAAFSLPILQLFGTNKVKIKSKHVRALILTPTRELASQIEDNIKLYGEGLNLSSAVIFGGVGKGPQITKMNKGVDILIATPGRLLDLMSEGLVKYDQLEMFVLDEADRMLDMGFFKDIKKVIAKLPAKKQTLLFSATMPPDIEKLAQNLLKNPVKVEITPQATTVEKINQTVCIVDKADKNGLLLSILDDNDIETALVFSRTKHGADRIVKFLERSRISCAAIHGNKSQGAREKALASFRAGKIRVLIATDIAARGIDIDSVTHVINYNLPEDAENYVHRIGRTARAGRSGTAISFCDETEHKYLKAIEKFIKLKITENTEHAFFSIPTKASKQKIAANQPVKAPKSAKSPSRPARTTPNKDESRKHPRRRRS